MPKKIRISVPKPCRENWDEMTPVERGRFCGSCQKQVMDFTNMSDSQLAAFFKKKPTGSVCGRFMSEQLNRTIDIPKKRIPWVKYFFQFTLPLFLGSLRAGAQQKEEVAVTQTDVKDIRPSDSTIGDTTFVVNPVDTIAVVDTTANAIDTVVSEEKEYTRINFNTNSILSRLITPDVIFDSIDCTPSRINWLGDSVWRTETITSGLFAIEEPNMEPTVIFMDDGSIRVYPNPLQGGSPVNIECKNLEEDFYYIQVLTQTGQPLFQKEIWIDKEAAVLNLPLPKIAAGTYFMVLTSRQKKRKFTEKIVILP